MNVRWLNWQEVMEEAGLLRNLDAQLHQIEAPEARRIAQAVNVAVDYAWKFHPWECACWVLRQLDDEADAPRPILETGYDVLEAYAANPLTAWEAGLEVRTVPFRAGQGALRFASTAPVTHYLVRSRAPRFGGDGWNVATAYAAGKLVYDPATGECWRAVTASTGAVLKVWQEWGQGEALEASPVVYRRRNGVLYYNNAGGDTDEETNAPGYGPNWLDMWATVPYAWAPMRLPEFLLTAVLAGARSWMESPDTAALQMAMLAALETEVSDFGITRRQRRPEGGVQTIL